SMESVRVTKPCSSYDIVPTIANLFGIEYDSRLITGKDILSEGENIAVLNLFENGSSWNWVTDKGFYDAKKDVFTPATVMSEQEAEEYKSTTVNKVDAMRKYSFAILDKDYYSYIFDKNGDEPTEAGT
ncbi:MAG: hypothetical protein IJ297_06105, partial [Clostridia bacterium]|nr:hypothetical protein [Clostridia bacterium]